MHFKAFQSFSCPGYRPWSCLSGPEDLGAWWLQVEDLFDAELQGKGQCKSMQITSNRLSFHLFSLLSHEFLNVFLNVFLCVSLCFLSLFISLYLF